MNTQKEEAKTRGHNRRLRRQIIKKYDKRHGFFTNRIVEDWNNLPQNVVDSKSFNSFKNSLDNFRYQLAVTVYRLLSLRLSR